MEIVGITALRAACHRILARVHRTGTPILVKRRGLPIAELVPVSSLERPTRWLGSLRDRGDVLGDIVSPATSETDWNVLKS